MRKEYTWFMIGFIFLLQFTQLTLSSCKENINSKNDSLQVKLKSGIPLPTDSLILPNLIGKSEVELYSTIKYSNDVTPIDVKNNDDGTEEYVKYMIRFIFNPQLIKTPEKELDVFMEDDTVIAIHWVPDNIK